MAEGMKQDDRPEIYSREFTIPEGGSIRIKFEIVPSALPEEKRQGVTDCCLKAEIRGERSSEYRPWFKRVPFSWLRLEDFLSLCRRIYSEACRRLARCRR